MSDEFLREVKEDLEKEKALIFLKKYGVSLAVGAAIILGGVAYYSWQKDQNETRYQAQASRFYMQSRDVAKDAKQSPDLNGLDAVYQALLVQIRANIFSSKEGQGDVAEKIILDFTEKNAFENTMNKDNFANSILHLNALSYQSETADLKTFENQVKDYARVNGAMKEFAYEILIARAIKDKDFDMASYYYELLQKEGVDSSQDRRLKVYASFLPNKVEPSETLKKVEIGE